MSKVSIRSQLQLWLLFPLCILAVVSTVIAYILTESFAEKLYDEIMVNSADSVATRVRIEDGKIRVDLPPAAQDILEHNDKDRFYFGVVTSDGKQISGDAPLPIPPEAWALGQWQSTFRNARVGGKEVRLGVVRMPVAVAKNGSVWIVVAETLNSRKQFANHIMWNVAMPQLSLIVLGAALVSLVVSRGLLPLKRFEEELAKRSQFELTPVVDDRFPIEMRPVVGALNDLLHRLRDDVEAQRRFALNAAHQLRTPIAGLKTYVGLLNRVQNEADKKEVLGHLEEGMDKLDRLVNGLLVLSRVEQTNNDFAVKKPIDLNDIACDVSRIFLAQAVGKDLEVVCIPSPEAALVLGDPIGLQELVSNLVENAILYTPIGGRVKICVSNNGTTDLTIEDTGPGVPPDERDRVFERFYRVLGTGVEGNGLGLAIVREVALMHDAEVSMDSAEDQAGTKVTVKFKRAC